MRTTLDIPKTLLSKAMDITGLRTKTDTIKYALESIIRQNSLQKIKNYHGKIKLNIDLDNLRKRD